MARKRRGRRGPENLALLRRAAGARRLQAVVCDPAQKPLRLSLFVFKKRSVTIWRSRTKRLRQEPSVDAGLGQEAR